MDIDPISENRVSGCDRQHSDVDDYGRLKGVVAVGRSLCSGLADVVYNLPLTLTMHAVAYLYLLFMHVPLDTPA